MLNSVSLTGRLCADPTLRTTADGTCVTTLILAVDRNYIAKDGERKTDFIDVVVWKKLAEFVCDNFKKGSYIAVNGNIRSRNYDDKDGNKRKAIEVEASDVSFCGPRSKE